MNPFSNLDIDIGHLGQHQCTVFPSSSSRCDDSPRSADHKVRHDDAVMMCSRGHMGQISASLMKRLCRFLKNKTAKLHKQFVSEKLKIAAHIFVVEAMSHLTVTL